MSLLNLPPSRLSALLCTTSICLLAIGLYLQHAQGLQPCPMCIVQRYALAFVAVSSGLAAVSERKFFKAGFMLLVLASAVFGAFVAARQSWLQWYPPEVATCGRDFYSMIELFPLSRLVPLIFQGSGDCSKVDWTFLSLSIANWSFLCFAAITMLAAGLLVRVAFWSKPSDS